MSEVSTEGTFFNGVIADIAEINPRTDIALAEEERVSFLPMQSTSESGDIIALQERVFAQVSKGYTRFAENDVLVAKITPCFENGKGGYAKGLLNGIGFGSTEFHIVRAIPGKADSRFLHHLTRSERFRKAGEGSMTGSAGQKRIPSNFIKDFPIFIPPLPEQKKIAEILSGIDSQLVTDSQKLDKLTKLLQALAEEEVCMRFREIPALPLSSFFADKPSNGISPPETEGDDFISAPGIDCISTSGFDTKRLKKVQRPPDWERYLIREGDFFITRANTPSLVGMCAVAKKVTQEMIYPDLMVRLQFAHADHGPYLESVFRSSFYRRIIQNSAQGTSQSMVKLNGQIISSIKISMPADSEVHRFNKNIEIISETIKSQKVRIERLQNMKAGLAYDLLSGRKRVSDARVPEGVGI